MRVANRLSFSRKPAVALHYNFLFYDRHPRRFRVVAKLVRGGYEPARSIQRLNAPKGALHDRAIDEVRLQNGYI